MNATNSEAVDQMALPIHMGEAKDFERIFASYNVPLRFYCEQLTGAGEESEDIISELFATLWLRQVRFENTEHAQAYLYRSVKNVCLNFIRDRDRNKQKQEVLQASETELSENYYDVFAKTEVWAELYRAIEGLPGQCCKVITMSYLDGMSNQEIADELYLSIKTVKNYKLRGLALLKDKLPDSLIVLLISNHFLK